MTISEIKEYSILDNGDLTDYIPVEDMRGILLELHTYAVLAVNTTTDTRYPNRVQGFPVWTGGMLTTDKNGKNTDYGDDIVIVFPVKEQADSLQAYLDSLQSA